ncbi:calmodulin-like [Drosophila nasuta]|uniref:calmodulin-like n=1 Tax=Drosophila nasuta TaxID=42062 RepID=UPI00295F080D|nr:calmodulin-like [Drosophila nasuta]
MELNDHERESFEWAFSLLTDDKSGFITQKELVGFLHALGKTASESQMNAMINEVDEDGNGFIDFKEFVTALSRKLSGNLDDDEIRDTFRVYDKDNTGFITADQVKTVFFDLDQPIADDEIDEMIRTYDSDGDGMLNYEEFVEMLTTR